MIPEWFDLGNSLQIPKEDIFVEYGRYSSKYRRIDLTTDKIDTVECNVTPVDVCPKNLLCLKELYTIDKKYYIAINKNNSRDVLVFKRMKIKLIQIEYLKLTRYHKHNFTI